MPSKKCVLGWDYNLITSAITVGVLRTEILDFKCAEGCLASEFNFFLLCLWEPCPELKHHPLGLHTTSSTSPLSFYLSFKFTIKTKKLSHTLSLLMPSLTIQDNWGWSQGDLLLELDPLPKDVPSILAL